MNEQAATLEAPAVPKAPKAPKAKKAAKPEAKANGLRKPQLRVLKALKSGRPMTRAQIGQKAEVDVAGLTEWIGSHDEATRKANDKKHFPSLLTLGLVKFAPGDDDGTVAYMITAKGTAAVNKA